MARHSVMATLRNARRTAARDERMEAAARLLTDEWRTAAEIGAHPAQLRALAGRKRGHKAEFRYDEHGRLVFRRTPTTTEVPS